MSQRKPKAPPIAAVSKIRNMNVIDLLLIDHKFIKECIVVFKRPDGHKTKNILLAKRFLDAVNQHSLAEKKAVYVPMEKNEELHFNILEAQIEHGLADQKVKLLKNKLSRVRVLKEDHEAELKVLSEIVEKHLMEEESEMFPKMKQEVAEHSLIEMGLEFMKLRKFDPLQLQQHPVLQDELIQWKDSVQKVSSQFLSKMDQYVENLKH